MTEAEASAAEIVDNVTFHVLKKSLSKVLSKLEFGKLDDTEIPVLIGIIDSYLKSPDIEWINEANKILQQYPEIRKYFNSYQGTL